MRQRISLALFVTALIPAVTSVAVEAQDGAADDKWQSVAKTDLQEAFVNPSSIVAVDGQLEARVKQNFLQPQPAASQGRTYLSSRTTYRFDCVQRRVAMREIRAYSGGDLQGDRVQKATSSDRNLQWLEAPDGTVFGELLEYVCSRSG